MNFDPNKRKSRDTRKPRSDYIAGQSAKATTHITGRPECPKCGSRYMKRNGRNLLGEQVYSCKSCKHGFTVPAPPKPSSGSGQFPSPKTYDAEIKPLWRDPLSHMKLCSENRK